MNSEGLLIISLNKIGLLLKPVYLAVICCKSNPFIIKISSKMSVSNESIKRSTYNWFCVRGCTLNLLDPRLLYASHAHVEHIPLVRTGLIEWSRYESRHQRRLIHLSEFTPTSWRIGIVLVVLAYIGQLWLDDAR